jgi:SAM-dependent methyltransferase
MQQGAGIVVPPEALRYRVSATRSAEEFLERGTVAAETIAHVLDAAGYRLAEFADVFDFGCGCGRVIQLLPRAGNLFGSDIDRDAIAWCRAHLPFATFSVNDPLPPLTYRDGSFDFVYAVSVFSHINEPAQLLWLKELQRVTRPGALVLVTVRGDAYLHEMSDDVRSTVERAGFAFAESSFWDGHFPLWYQTTQHTQAYVERTFTRYFTLVDYIPGGLRGGQGRQDIVVLQRPKTLPHAHHDEDALRRRWHEEYTLLLERRCDGLIGDLRTTHGALAEAKEYAQHLEAALALHIAEQRRAALHVAHLEAEIGGRRGVISPDTGPVT